MCVCVCVCERERERERSGMNRRRKKQAVKTTCWQRAKRAKHANLCSDAVHVSKKEKQTRSDFSASGP